MTSQILSPRRDSDKQTTKEICMANDASEHLVGAFYDRSVHKKTEIGLKFEFEEKI